MGSLWRKCIQNAADRDQVANKLTWGDYARKIFTKILQRHPSTKEFHLVYYRFDMDLSIKDAEHKKSSALFIGGSKNIFSSSIDTILLARKFSSFFANSENKITLHEFLLKILPRSTRKISALKKNVFRVFRFQQNRPYFAIKKGLIREYFIMLKY